jgi:hypothetical protein
MSRQVEPTRRTQDGNPVLVKFVNWFADQLDADFDVEDYGFDGRLFTVEYEDGTWVELNVAVSE